MIAAFLMYPLERLKTALDLQKRCLLDVSSGELYSLLASQLEQHSGSNAIIVLDLTRYDLFEALCRLRAQNDDCWAGPMPLPVLSAAVCVDDRVALLVYTQQFLSCRFALPESRVYTYGHFPQRQSL